MRKKLLFISHEASRTGAPIMLLNLLKWLKENTDLSLTILFKDDGVLRSAFEEIGPTYVLNKKPVQFLLGNFPRVSLLVQIIMTKINKKMFLLKFNKKEFNLIYANSVATCDIVNEITYFFKCAKICHVHEMDMAIKTICGKDAFSKSDGYFDKYIAVSRAVCSNLINNCKIDEKKITLIHGSIPIYVDNDGCSKKSDKPNSIKTELSLGKDSLIVGGAGELNWYKAPEIFVQLAYLTKQQNNNKKIIFCWVGGETKGLLYEQLSYDIRELNLSDTVFFLGRKEQPYLYFDDFDIFTLTSREDSFPLVCLEVALLGKPIICFENAGGAQELVEDDAGIIVPYLDINKMAEKIIQLAENKILRECLGKRATEKVIKDYNISYAAPKILDIIRQYY